MVYVLRQHRAGTPNRLAPKPRAQRRLLHREGSRSTGHPLAPPRDQGGTPHGHRVSGPPIQRSLSAYRTAPMLFAQPARTAFNNRQLPSWRRTGLGSIPIGSVSITPPPRMCHTLPQQHHLPDTRQKAQVLGFASNIIFDCEIFTLITPPMISSFKIGSLSAFSTIIVSVKIPLTHPPTC